MVKQVHIETCLECGAPDPGLSLICEKCEPLYAVPCECAVCVSDLADIAPCLIAKAID